MTTIWLKKQKRQKPKRNRSRCPALRICSGNISITDVTTTSMARNCTEGTDHTGSAHSQLKRCFLKRKEKKSSHLCVQPQENDHDKEADGPQLGQWHHGYGLRVRNKRQAWAWEATSQSGLETPNMTDSWSPTASSKWSIIPVKALRIH